MTSNESDTLDCVIDRLYGQDKLAICELFSAATVSGPYIYCDEEVPQRLVGAGLLNKDLSMPDTVRNIVCRKFTWAD